MGRGRAKAKQAKVARALKYHSPDTDLAALQRELGGRPADEGYARRQGASSEDHEPDSEADEFEEYADEDVDDEDDTDDGNWATRHS